MDLVHTAALVGFGALCQGCEKTAEILPRGIAKDDGAGWVVLMKEGAQEGIEVIWGGGEIEPRWVDQGFYPFVQLRHSKDWSGFRDKSAAEDANRGGGHRNLYTQFRQDIAMV